MFFHFVPACPWWLFFLWLFLLLFFVVSSFQRLASKVQFGYRCLLVGLEAATILFGSLLLLQPQRRSRQPEPGSFRIAILADQSLSMNARDGHGQENRMAVMTRLLHREESPLARLAALGRLELNGFTEELQPITYQNQLPQLEPLPGRTALGTALRQVLTKSDSRAPLGAVLLLSDGRNNAGESPTEVAKQYQARKIPISCVGIGRPGIAPDLSVQADNDSLTAQRDAPFSIAATVASTYPTSQQVTVALLEHGNVLASQEIELAPQQSRNLTFVHQTPVAGHHTYVIRLEPPSNDSRPDNDLDFISVEVREPPTFEVLYLAGALDWEWRFLNIYAQNSEQLTLAAIIKTGSESFFMAGLPEETGVTRQNFPENAAFYEDFDAVILDTRLASALSAKTLTALRSFTENKGGGLLLRGPLESLPPEFHDLLPAQKTVAARSAREMRLSTSEDFIFGRDLAGILQSPGAMLVAPGANMRFAQDLKRAARSALSLAGQEQSTLLAAMSYGAGRCAWLGLDNTWRWRLRAENGQLAHETFWNLLLVWLSETSKPRMRMHCSGSKIGLGENLPLDIDLLGDDFQPAPDAKVTATVMLPNGEQRTLLLEPSGETIGRYEAVFHPTDSGEHRVDYEVQLPDSQLRRSAVFIARPIGVEAEDTSFNEEMLRDLARISNGRYYTPATFMSQGHDLPCSENVPWREDTKPLLPPWLTLLLFATAATMFWGARRRIGMK